MIKISYVGFFLFSFACCQVNLDKPDFCEFELKISVNLNNVKSANVLISGCMLLCSMLNVQLFMQQQLFITAWNIIYITVLTVGIVRKM